MGNKFKTGWRWLLIKAACTLVVVLLTELLLGALTNNEPLGKTLRPFHNHYFSFSSYYLTNQGMGSGFSDGPWATTRFVIYLVPGYLIYAVLTILTGLTPVSKQKIDRTNAVLFYVMVAGAFLLAFFFPPRITVIDSARKEVCVTRFRYFFIPAAVYIPFNDIDKIECNAVSDYDGYNKVYVNYLVISLTTRTGTRISLGEMQAGEQKGTLMHKPGIMVAVEKKGMAEEMISEIEAVVR